MDGTILNFDAVSGDGVIRAADGNRYKFSALDWCSAGSPIIGDVVDFEPVDGRATELYVTSRVPVAAETVPVLVTAPAPVSQEASEQSLAAVPPQLEPAANFVAPQMPSGLGARFFIFYFLTLIPTYVLPYFLSNSAVFNEASVAMTGSFSLQFWWHLSCYPVAIFLAYIRGVRIARPWLVAFPILAGIFDLMPVLNFIPLVPSILNLAALFVGASRTAPPDYQVPKMDQKFEFGLWGIAAYAGFAILKIWTAGIGHEGGFAKSLLLWPVLGLAVFFALKYRAGQGAVFVGNLTSAFGDAAAPAAVPEPARPEPAHMADMEAIAGGDVAVPSATGKFCGACGQTALEDDRFCGECGTLL